MKLSAAERRRRADQAAAAMDEEAGRIETIVAGAYRRALVPSLARAVPQAMTAAGDVPDPPDFDALGGIPSAWADEMAAVILPALAEAFARFSGMLLDEFSDAAARRAAAAGLRGIDDVIATAQAEWLSAASNRLVGIGDGAWTMAAESLREGFMAGESIPELRDRVAEAVQVGEGRARTIARTETTGAANGGQMAASRALGSFGPSGKEWLATGDGRTRASHAEADGQVVGLDEQFDVGGYGLDYPGDPFGPAEEVVNCRCTVVYLDGDGGVSEDAPDGVVAGDEDEDPEAIAAAATLPAEEAPPMSVRERRYHDVVRRSFAAPTAPIPPAPAPTVPDAPVPPDPSAVAAVPPVGRPFEILLTVEGRWTGDDRCMLVGALEWDGLLPFPVTLGHSDDPRDICAHVDEVERIPNGDTEAFIIGRGTLDDVGDQGVEAIRQIERGDLRGCSVDIDDMDMGGIDPTTITSEDDLYWSMVVERARLRAVALVPIGAFAEAYITLGAVDTTTLPPPVSGPTPVTSVEAAQIEEQIEEAMADAEEEILPIVLLASIGTNPTRRGAAPALRLVAPGPSRFSPPVAAFQRPEADGPTPFTILEPDEHGIRHAYGHLAEWGVCHTGYPGVCVTAPPSPTDYAYFNLTPFQCCDGEAMIGRLTVGTGHADKRLGWRDTTAHYDNSGHSAALVTVSDGAHGIWACGIVDPLATEEQIFELRTHPLSGDWRSIGGELELVAALAVNSPGFPVVSTRVASGRQQTLIAAGVLGRPDTIRWRPRGDDRGRRAAASRIAASIGRDPAARAAALRSRVHG